MITKNSEIIWRIVDGEALLLNTHSGFYYSLNETGAVIWAHLEEGNSPLKVAELLAEEFDIDVETASNDVDKLIETLRAENIIES